jgi:periplasmic divalent cation tolerance protein
VVATASVGCPTGPSCLLSSPSTSCARSALTTAGDVPDVVQLTVTIERRDDADHLADLLLDRRLVACVQILGPVQSRYRWDGEITQSSEYLLLVKTVGARVDAVTQAIVDAHPYDVPEVLALPVVGGHQPYLDWVTENVD